MTSYYTLELIKHSVTLKLTYRSGKFLKLEKQKGKLTDEMLLKIGHIIPPLEDKIMTYNDRFRESVEIRYISKPVKVAKQKSQFSKYNSAWFGFFSKFNGFAPKFSATDGKALKMIIAHLEQISNTEDEAYAMWQVILDQWKNLDKFHQQHTDLKYINSQLNVILTAIKKSNSDNGTVFTKAMASETARTFKFK